MLSGFGHWVFVMPVQLRSGTLAGLCFLFAALWALKERPRYKPRPLHTTGLLVLSGAGQNNHDWQRQNKKNNHKARLLASMVSLRLLPVKQIVQQFACLLVRFRQSVAVDVKCCGSSGMAQPF